MIRFRDHIGLVDIGERIKERQTDDEDMAVGMVGFNADLFVYGVIDRPTPQDMGISG